MKKTITSILCLFAGIAFGQSAITNIGTPALNALQTRYYNDFMALPDVSTVYFVSTKLDSTTIDSTGKLRINDLSIFSRVISMQLDNMQITDPNNFTMSGNEFRANPTPASPTPFDGYSNLLLVKAAGELLGHLNIDGNHYKLYDLTGGIQLLCYLDPSTYTSARDCADDIHSNPVPEQTSAPTSCVDRIVKVLVLFTPAAYAKNSHVVQIAHAGVADLNTIWASSATPLDVQFAALQGLNFTEGTNAPADLSTIASNPTVTALRSFFKAEVVVVLVDIDSYQAINGQAMDIGANFGSAFCIVDVNTAVGPRHTFAHEVTHLFGGRHNNDFTPGDARGWAFLTSNTQRNTLMHLTTPRITFVSNPNVSLLGVATGYIHANNAQAVTAFQNVIPSFYYDGTNNPSLEIVRATTDPCVPYWNVTVKNFCPTEDHGPYTYKWYRYSFIQALNPLLGASPVMTYLGTGNNFWIYNPYAFQYIACKVYDSSNNLVWQGAKLVQAVNQSGGCIGYRTANTTTGINELNAGNIEVVAYPNPSPNSFVVKINNTEGRNEFALKDVLGKVIGISVALVENDNTYNVTPNTSLSAGVYFLTVRTGNRTEVKRIIVE